MRLPTLIKVRQRVARVAAERLQADGRKVRADRDADECVLLLHLPLRGGDARVALQQLRRHATPGPAAPCAASGASAMLSSDGRCPRQHGDGVLDRFRAAAPRPPAAPAWPRSEACAAATIAVGRRAGLELILRDLERALIERHRLREERAQRVGGAQIEIVGGECRLRRQLGIREIGLAHLHAGLAALDLAADRSPDVGLPGSQSLRG